MSFIRNNLLNGFMIAATGVAGFGLGDSLEKIAAREFVGKAATTKDQIELNEALESHGENRKQEISDLQSKHVYQKVEESRWRDTNFVAYTLAGSFACLSWLSVMIASGSKEDELISVHNNRLERELKTTASEAFEQGYAHGLQNVSNTPNIIHATASALNMNPNDLFVMSPARVVSLLKFAGAREAADSNIVN